MKKRDSDYDSLNNSVKGGLIDSADQSEMIDDEMVFSDDDEHLSVDDDIIQFTDDEATSSSSSSEPLAPSDLWHVLVVDDDPDVLAVTQLALSRLTVHERTLKLHVVQSATEARAALRERDDFALMISDVVMESERAGLILISWVRSQPTHRHMRIVIRTGEPGQAPEEKVLQELDINDYWPKTELTAHRMRTLVIGLLGIGKIIELQN